MPEQRKPTLDELIACETLANARQYSADNLRLEFEEAGIDSCKEAVSLAKAIKRIKEIALDLSLAPSEAEVRILEVIEELGDA